MRWSEPGAAYVPFIGDGDLAVDLYTDRTVYGADLDPDRIANARSRLRSSVLRVADCDSWPFPDFAEERFAVADFDAYVDPYISFRSFWCKTELADRMVLFFTDGRRQGLLRSGSWTRPDGTKVKLEHGSPEKARVFNFYLSCEIWPWFDEFVSPWRVLDRFRYQRSLMIYWGAVVSRP